eukprot:TRINITY_DN2488_c0_g2_i1.p1 TRINITY_DN2488_c0_g2~~TRINITY_DN2488_c0_g2_i1.p1  ORF type:complete len:191 (-),score=38.83 TRINITY_DN2488_c0_g2_i1:57-599(-)
MDRIHLFLTILLALTAMVEAGTPKSPRAFDSQVTTYFNNQQFNGTLSYDLSLHSSLLTGNFQGATITSLKRYDMGKSWTITKMNSNIQCRFDAYIDPSQEDIFGWVQYASYVGQEQIEGFNCGLYQYQNQGTVLQACYLPDMKTPVYLNLNQAVSYIFWNFKIRSQKSSAFAVPSYCPQQ